MVTAGSPRSRAPAKTTAAPTSHRWAWVIPGQETGETQRSRAEATDTHCSKVASESTDECFWRRHQGSYLHPGSTNVPSDLPAPASGAQEGAPFPTLCNIMGPSLSFSHSAEQD